MSTSTTEESVCYSLDNQDVICTVFLGIGVDRAAFRDEMLAASYLVTRRRRRASTGVEHVGLKEAELQN